MPRRPDREDYLRDRRDYSDELPGVDWLLQNPRETRRLETVAKYAGVPAHRDDRQAFVLRSKLFGEPYAVLVRHRQIGQDHVRPKAGAKLDCFSGGAGGSHERAAVLKHALPEITGVAVVFDDQDVNPGQARSIVYRACSSDGSEAGASPFSLSRFGRGHVPHYTGAG